MKTQKGRTLKVLLFVGFASLFGGLEWDAML